MIERSAKSKMQDSMIRIHTGKIQKLSVFNFRIFSQNITGLVRWRIILETRNIYNIQSTLTISNTRGPDIELTIENCCLQRTFVPFLLTKYFCQYSIAVYIFVSISSQFYIDVRYKGVATFVDRHLRNRHLRTDTSI